MNGIQGRIFRASRIKSAGGKPKVVSDSIESAVGRLRGWGVRSPKLAARDRAFAERLLDFFQFVERTAQVALVRFRRDRPAAGAAGQDAGPLGVLQEGAPPAMVASLVGQARIERRAQ